MEWLSKTWKVNVIPKSFLKCCLSDAGDGILSDDSEQSLKGPSSSENESVIEGSWDRLSA
jgi:hypothetical protein